MDNDQITAEKILDLQIDSAYKYIPAVDKNDFMRKLENSQREVILYAMEEYAALKIKQLEEDRKWISTIDQLPDNGQNIIFIVDMPNDNRHNRIYAGWFNGKDFSCMGYGCKASYWMPSPEMPIVKK